MTQVRAGERSQDGYKTLSIEGSGARLAIASFLEMNELEAKSYYQSMGELMSYYKRAGNSYCWQDYRFPHSVSENTVKLLKSAI